MYVCCFLKAGIVFVLNQNCRLKLTINLCLCWEVIADCSTFYVRILFGGGFLFGLVSIV